MVARVSPRVAFLALALVVAFAGTACDKKARRVGVGSPCTTVADCPGDLGCNFVGQCVEPGGTCRGAGDCAFGQVCTAGRCIDPEGADADRVDGDDTAGEPDEAGPTGSLRPSPTDIDFGGVATGERRTQTVTLNNVGTAAVRVTGLRLEGINAPPFEAPTADGGSLPAVVAGSGALRVTLAFNGDDGTHQGFLVVTTDEAGAPELRIPVSARPKGRGVLSCEPATLNLRPTSPNLTTRGQFVCLNNGTAPLQLTAATIVDATGGTFGVTLVTGSLPITIPPSAPGITPTYLAATFVHDTIGNYSARVRIETADEGSEPQFVQLNATVADIVVKGRVICTDRVSLPNAPPATPVEKAFTCTNLGPGPVTIDGARIEAQPAGGFFSVSPDTGAVFPLPLNAGEAVSLIATFVGDTFGTYQATALMAIGNGEAAEVGSRLIAEVRRVPTGPCRLVCEPGSVDFGRVPPGSPRTLSVGCRNDGGANMTVSGVQYQAPGEFRVVHPPVPTVVPGGRTFPIQITYSPRDPNPDGFEIKVSVEGACEGALSQTIDVQGALGVNPVLPRCIPPRTFTSQRRWERKSFTAFPSWTQSWSTPVIAQFTDDNNDGRIDLDDDPDVLITTTECIICATGGANDPRPSVIRVLDGKTGTEKLTIGSPGQFVESEAHIAVADIDLDNKPEVIAVLYDYDPSKARCQRFIEAQFRAQGQECPEALRLANKVADGRLVAFEHDGTLKWTSERMNRNPDEIENMVAVTVTDLDGDGVPEILVANAVYDNTGALKWTTGPDDYPTEGNGVMSAAADLDKDGKLEVIIGGVAWRHDGSIYFRNTVPSGFPGAPPTLLPGMPAVADVDGDGFAEIVTMSGGYVSLIEHDGRVTISMQQLEWEECNPGDGSTPQQRSMISTGPALADFDGDGKAEPVFATESRIGVFKPRGNRFEPVWTSDMQDCSGASHPSAFDFEGDGKYEVVMGDESKVQIFRGTNGLKMYQDDRYSLTGGEATAIGDVDGDGHADLVSVLNAGGFGLQGGVRVYTAATNDWVATYEVFNQHQYHVTNVTNAFTVPPIVNWWEGQWARYNGFRAQMPFCEP